MPRLILKAPYYSPVSRSANGGGRGRYAEYIATREGAEIIKDRGGMASYIGERKGSNGLFSDAGVPIVLSRISDEVNNHPGNIWGFIVSLRRDDAERYGYNNAESWMNLIRSHRNDIAKQMHISPENFRWYAAYHQKDTHPHVHILAWSDKPGEPYLSRKGIENIKSTFANDIFRQELYTLYSRQSAVRDRIRQTYRDRLEELKEKRRPADNGIALMLSDLSVRLKKVKGKKQYGYLSKSLKKRVDEIVRLISDQPDIRKMYDLWYELQCEKYRTYTDVVPNKVPLEESKEFKAVRNAVINSAKAICQTNGTKIDLQPKDYVAAIVKFTSSLIYDSAPSFSREEEYDDIDRQLKKEIRMVKNGEPVLSM